MSLLVMGLALAMCCQATAASYAKKGIAGDELFTGPVPRLRIDIPSEGMAVLREYNQVWRQTRPPRIDVRATVREGGKTYTNVAIHLKGSFSFQPIDAKPSLTLNFNKFAPGQKFHGLKKTHLNNSVQDPSYLCEQFARELFTDVGVPSPRATPALVNLNGRDLGVSVLVEGANRQFVKQHFESTQGNLYDGGSGGDVTKALKVDSGEKPNDRSDLTNLVKAAREPDLAKRMARLEQVLDLEKFITFAATEAFIVHWDGYAIGGNNYRVFHDVSRDKMIFMPHGMDQLFGVSRPITMSVTPPFKGMVAKSLFAVPEARRAYLRRLEELSTNELRVAALHARVNRLATRLRPALPPGTETADLFDAMVANLKSRISRRAQIVAQQLSAPQPTTPLAQDGSVRLAAWSFKAGPTLAAAASRTRSDKGEILRVTGRGTDSSGAWRTVVLLGPGRYEFSGKARTEGITAGVPGTNGVILRVSGERSTRGITIADEWKPLSYEFTVNGIEDVELVCEFRGPQGSGFFDVSSLRLVRRED
jgi:spore coat protein H